MDEWAGRSYQALCHKTKPCMPWNVAHGRRQKFRKILRRDKSVIARILQDAI
jgi:hypothetical protein